MTKWYGPHCNRQQPWSIIIGSTMFFDVRVLLYLHGYAKRSWKTCQCVHVHVKRVTHLQSLLLMLSSRLVTLLEVGYRHVRSIKFFSFFLLYLCPVSVSLTPSANIDVAREVRVHIPQQNSVWETYPSVHGGKWRLAFVPSLLWTCQPAVLLKFSATSSPLHPQPGVSG